MGEILERIGILVALNLIVYFRVLRYDYIIDDNIVPQGKGKNFLHTFWLQITCRQYSSCPMEHLQRVVVHIINCCLIYIVFGKSDVSFVAALLFSVNPWGNQVPCWLNAMGYGMSCMLVLLMIWFKHLAIVFYLFTMIWHITPAFAPFLFLYLGPWQFIFFLIPYFMVVFFAKGRVPLYKITYNTATVQDRHKYMNRTLRRIYPRKFIFIIKTYAYYFLHIFFPRRLGLFHSFGFSFGLHPEDTKKWQRASPLFFFGVILAATNIYLMIRFWSTPLGFGLFWFHLFIGQWCNFMIFYQTITDRYSYLAQVGLMYALAYVLSLIPHGDWIAVAFLTFYVAKISYYLPAFKDMESYIEMNLIEFPDSWASYNWRGILASGKNQRFSAIQAFAKGLHFRPHDYRLNFNLGQILRTLGYFDEAEKYLHIAGQALLDERKAEFRQEEAKAVEDALADIKQRRAEIRAKKMGIIIPPSDKKIIQP